MDLHPSIPNQVGLGALKEAPDNRSVTRIPTENLIKMDKFVLNNNLFKFNNKVFQQNIRNGNAWIYLNRDEQGFLETHELQPLSWLRYIDFFSFGLTEKNN